ncbi:hemin uptake protein HemP [Celeribacter baekdonensis]|uniref:Hemin uptake protein HemP n=1 Tax=Celeribacter baekdonensis B30 TaxID=1208323 RepID=K2J713_9RHOB|nr:hypothetical protein B30_11752 [Celeribacter baekdonensis B30]KAB6715888.1 hemin uptake protein HemP [Roseobacter sp. TSBP12]
MTLHVTKMEAAETQLPPIDARSLISDGSTRQIILDGQIYTLRITRAQKLILTK